MTGQESSSSGKGSARRGSEVCLGTATECLLKETEQILQKMKLTTEAPRKDLCQYKRLPVKKYEVYEAEKVGQGNSEVLKP